MRGGGTRAALACLAVVSVFLTACSDDSAAQKESEVAPTPSTSSGPSGADALRPKGAAEDALTRYEATLQSIAAEIDTLVPGVTWEWNHTADFLLCTGEYADSGGVRVGTRNLVASKPLPDEAWPAVLRVVQARAAELGATETFVYADEPGRHEVAISGNGIEFRVGTSKRALLSAMSDCYLRRSDL